MADEAHEVVGDQTAAAPQAEATGPSPDAQPVDSAASVAAPEDTAPLNAHAEPTLLQQVASPGTETPPEAKAEGADAAPAADGADKPETAEVAKADEKPEVKAEEAKSDAKADADAAPKEEAKADAVPALEPVEYKYELPETIKMDDAVKDAFHGALDKFRADPTTGAQDLINMHNEQMGKYHDHLLQEQHRLWADTRSAWRKEVLADPEIGGAGHQTAMQAIARVRDEFISQHPRNSAEYMVDMNAFNGMLQTTGIGDHPVFLKMLHNVARFWDEPGLPTQEAKPVPNNGAKRGGSVLYDNPRSTRRQ